jgi:hypothetical protein
VSWQQQQNVFTVASKTNEATLQTSFTTLQIIDQKPDGKLRSAKGKHQKYSVTINNGFLNIRLSVNLVTESVTDVAGDFSVNFKEKSKNYVAIEKGQMFKIMHGLLFFIR